MEFSEFKRIREKLSLTQSELAEAFGVSNANVVGNIETVFRNPGNTICQMLRLLDSLSIIEAKELVEKLRQQNRLYNEA